MGCRGHDGSLGERTCRTRRQNTGATRCYREQGSGSGVIGINAVTKAAPDGYTIRTMRYSAKVIIPHLRAVPFDTKKDSPSLKTRILSTASPGPSSGQQIFMRPVFNLEKVKVKHFPMGGGAKPTGSCSASTWMQRSHYPRFHLFDGVT
jgi:hypothetical protein